MTAWGQLCEGDRVLSRNGKWYTVRAVAALDGARVRVAFETVAKSFIKPAAEDAGEVQRGASGATVDVLAAALGGGTVLSSGPSGRKE